MEGLFITIIIGGTICMVVRQTLAFKYQSALVEVKRLETLNAKTQLDYKCKLEELTILSDKASDRILCLINSYQGETTTVMKDFMKCANEQLDYYLRE